MSDGSAGFQAMSGVLIFVSRFAIAMGGYVLAVIVAVLVSVFLILLPTVLPDEGAWGSFYRSMQDLPLLIPYGLLLTGIFAFPGFAITLVLAAVFRWRHWLPFSIAGGLDAVLALGLLVANSNASIAEIPGGAMILYVPGGLAGGFAYWITAGEFLARTRAIEAV